MSLTVVRAVGLVTVQDFGRPGHMHEGLASGGALVRELLAQANRRAGNDDDAAGIEVMGLLTLRATAPVTVATDAERARRLEPGAELTVTNDRFRAAYVAVTGGIDEPKVLGSRSAQPSAGLGRLLRAGDAVRHVPMPPLSGSARRLDEFSAEGPIRVVPGPDADAFAPDALATLLAAAWTVSSSSNRVGTRLEGPSLARTDRPDVTRPMVRGAIEVPRDGQPIVLGPEHPTTGGYPVIAVVAFDDIGRLMATPPGQAVHFGAE